MHLILNRYRPSENCVLGNIKIVGLEHNPIYTLENPWMNNKPWISCIPAGDYALKRKHSGKFGATWELFTVDGRTDILIHAGNTEKDTSGCILVGTASGRLTDSKKQSHLAVLNSRDGMLELNRLLNEDEAHTITIVGDEHVKA